MKQYIITMTVLIFASILGFVLPSQIMKWKDEQQVNISYTENAEEVALVSQAALSLTEKMELYQRETANNLGVTRGKNYDQESIQPKVKEELKKLCDLGILDIDLDTIEFAAFEGGFVVDTADSTQTMNIWTVYAHHAKKGYQLWFVLDDETGKIFAIRQLEQLYDSIVESKKKVTTNMASDVSLEESAYTNEALQKIAESWAEYLELNLVETHHTVTGTMDADAEVKREIMALIEQGMNEKEAYLKVYEAWGIDTEYMKGHLLCVVEDEKGMASYLIREGIGNMMLSISLSMG